MTTHPPLPLAGSWDSGALLNKAMLYSERMHEYLECDDPQCGLWSALALELLSRAALAYVSPVLLADNKDWNNVYYGLGYRPKKSKFTQKSIAIAEVFERLSTTNIHFTDEIKGFCLEHMIRRNSELHAADLAFDEVSNSAWLAKFYQACSVLLESMGRNLDDFIGEDRAKTARTLIAAMNEKSAQAVKEQVDSHRTVWNSKDKNERKKLKEQAEIAVRRADGHIVDCPACGSKALLTGEPISPPRTLLESDMITEIQQCLPSRFECGACGLKISGLSQLTACNLGDTYAKKSIYDAIAYYTDAGFAGYDDDNNEPY